MLDGRRCEIGRTEELLRDPRALNVALMEAIEDAIDVKLTHRQWTSVVRLISRSAEKHPMEMLEREHRALDLVAEFLFESVDREEKTVDEKVSQGLTFVHEEELHLRREALKQYARRGDREISERRLDMAMKDLGFEGRRINFRWGDRRSTRSYFVAPIIKLPPRLRDFLSSEASE